MVVYSFNLLLIAFIIFSLSSVSPTILFEVAGKLKTESGMMMKYCLLLALVITTLSGCSLPYHVFLCNNSYTDVYLKTYPLIESLYPTVPYYGIERILGRKVSQEGGYGIYKINANDTFQVDVDLDLKPQNTSLYFEYLSIMNGADTIELKGKEEIVDGIMLMGIVKSRKNYYIEVGKKK
jgi:hypothetical protein